MMSKRGSLFLSAATVAGILTAGVFWNTARNGRGLAKKVAEHGNVAFDVANDGERLVFSASDGNLYLFRLHTSTVTALTTTKERESTPAFSPDGKFVAYSRETEDKKGASLFLHSLENGQTRPLTSGTGFKDYAPSFSSDGSRLVFARANRHRPYSMGGWTWDDWDVYTVKTDGTDLHRLTQQKYYQLGRPRFTADNKRVLFSADVDAYSRLFVVDARGGKPAPLTGVPPTPRQGGSWGSEPDVSPDGTQFAFISDRAKSYAYDILLANMNGANPRTLGLTRVSPYNQNPVFTPDGKRVLFLAGTEKNIWNRPVFSLWQADTDGQKAHQIADSSLFTAPLRWKPTR